MKDAFLSVVIITYNMANLLNEALLSLKQQTCQLFNVIVVDNYSSDNTDEIIKAYSKCLNIEHHKIHNNGILSKSRNIGILKSSTDWIAFLDSDDLWKSNKVEALRNVVENISENVIAISHACEETNVSNGKTRLLSYKTKYGNLYKDLLIEGNSLCMSSMVIRRKATENVGLFSEDQKYVMVEDYEYWIRLAKAGDIHYIDSVLATIIIHDNNLSKKATIQMNALYALTCDVVENDPSLTKYEIKKIFKRVYKLMARLYQKNSFFVDAKVCCKKYFKNYLFSPRIFIIYLLSIMKCNV